MNRRSPQGVKKHSQPAKMSGRFEYPRPDVPALAVQFGFGGKV